MSESIGIYYPSPRKSLLPLCYLRNVRVGVEREPKVLKNLMFFKFMAKRAMPRELFAVYYRKLHPPSTPGSGDAQLYPHRVEGRDCVSRTIATKPVITLNHAKTRSHHGS